jgi:hypothetical protein
LADLSEAAAKSRRPSAGLATLLVNVSSCLPASGKHIFSPSHLCPHQQMPSALIKQVPVPQQRVSSIIHITFYKIGLIKQSNILPDLLHHPTASPNCITQLHHPTSSPNFITQLHHPTPSE